MLNSHWGRAARGKKTSCIYALRVPYVLSYSLWHSRLRPARLLCQEGSSPGKNTGAYWPILVARLFWSTTFPAALAANSFEHLVLPEPLRPEQLQHIHPWPSQGRRAVWLRKRTQLYKCRLKPHDPLGRLCVYGICKRSLRAPTKENALVLTAVDTGGENTKEQDQIRIWAAPRAGPEISSVEGHRREVRWTVCYSQWGKGLWQQWLKKNIYYTYVLICSVDSFEFFFFFVSFIFPLCWSCQFYWHYGI